MRKKEAFQEIVVRGEHISICTECWREPCVCEAEDWEEITEDEEEG